MKIEEKKLLSSCGIILGRMQLGVAEWAHQTLRKKRNCLTCFHPVVDLNLAPLIPHAAWKCLDGECMNLRVCIYLETNFMLPSPIHGFAFPPKSTHMVKILGVAQLADRHSTSECASQVAYAGEYFSNGLGSLQYKFTRNHHPSIHRCEIKHLQRNVLGRMLQQWERCPNRCLKRVQMVSSCWSFWSGRRAPIQIYICTYKLYICIYIY